MAELVGLAVRDLQRALLGQRALGDDDDREHATARVAAPDQLADLVEVERLLGDQDHVGAAGEPGVERDPAGVAAHHLDHHHPVVGLGRGVQAVDRLGRDVQRGVEAEGDVGGAEVVVDRLRHPEHVDAVLGVQPVRARRACPRRRSRSARRGPALSRFSRSARPRPRALKGFVREVPRIVPPRGRIPRVGLDRQLLVIVLERPAPAVAKADDRVPVARRSPLRTIARMTAFRPGQSPPPVSTPSRTRPRYPRARRPATGAQAARASGCAQRSSTPLKRMKRKISAPTRAAEREGVGDDHQDQPDDGEDEQAHGPEIYRLELDTAARAAARKSVTAARPRRRRRRPRRRRGPAGCRRSRRRRSGRPRPPARGCRSRSRPRPGPATRPGSPSTSSREPGAAARRARRWSGCRRRGRRSPRRRRRSAPGARAASSGRPAGPAASPASRSARGDLAASSRRQVGHDRARRAGVGERARRSARGRARGPCSRRPSATTGTRSASRSQISSTDVERGAGRRAPRSRPRGSPARRRAGRRTGRRARSGRRRRRRRHRRRRASLAVREAAHQVRHQRRAALRRARAANAAAIGSAIAPSRVDDLGQVLVAAAAEREDVSEVLVAAPAQASAGRSPRPAWLCQQPRDRVRGLERRDDPLEPRQLAEGAPAPRRR